MDLITLSVTSSTSPGTGINRENVLDLDEREVVLFRPEPGNQDDPNAVELVRQNGDRVGYVNRMQARTGASLASAWQHRGMGVQD